MAILENFSLWAALTSIFFAPICESTDSAYFIEKGRLVFNH